MPHLKIKGWTLFENELPSRIYEPMKHKISNLHSPPCTIKVS